MKQTVIAKQYINHSNITEEILYRYFYCKTPWAKLYGDLQKKIIFTKHLNNDKALAGVAVD